MMRVGRISAVLAMLAFQPAAVVNAGSCPHTRTDTNNCTAGAASSLGCTGGYGDTNSDGDSGLWAAGCSLDLSDAGDLGSYAGGSWNGDVWVTGGYVPQGSATTITQGGVGAGPYCFAGIYGSPPDVIADTNDKTFLIGDDGDNVTEQVTVTGTINLEVTASYSGPADGYVISSAYVIGPGIEASIGMYADMDGTHVGGYVIYTDENFEQQELDPADFLDGDTVTISLTTKALLYEGDSFTVRSRSLSGTALSVYDSTSAASQGTSAADWSFASVAP